MQPIQRTRHFVKKALLSISMTCVFAAIGEAVDAQASSRPFWTEQAMFRFGEDLFFAGRASCAASAELGRQRAYNAALQEIMNYTRTQDIAGITIETQMIFEEFNSSECSDGQVSVWRLLRAPSSRLDRLNKMAVQPPSSSDQRIGKPGQPKQVPDLTPKIGMYKDEAFEIFGQPKTVSLLRSAGGEASWEYSKFGLTLVFDKDGYLVRWRHLGPSSTQQGDWNHSEYAGLEGSVGPQDKKKGEDQAVDLSKRLEKMQLESSSRQGETDAIKYCERAYPRDPRLQNSCIQYETEKTKRFSSPNTDIAMDADRTAKLICASRWPNDMALRGSCQNFERERILKAQSRRY
jgi:hypothetical protein